MGNAVNKNIAENRESFHLLEEQPAVDLSTSTEGSSQATAPVEELKKLLGPLVTATLRDAGGKLDPSKIHAKNFGEFREFLRTQVSIDGISFNQFVFASYHKVLGDAKYEPLLRALYGKTDPAESPASPADINTLLPQFTAELIAVSADQFVGRNFSTAEGRNRLRHVLGDVGHYTKELRSDLVKAIAVTGKNHGVAGQSYDDLADQISPWNWYNVQVTDAELKEASRQAGTILAKADGAEVIHKKLQSSYLEAPEEVRALKAALLERPITSADIQKMSVLAQAKASKADLLSRTQGKLAELWLVAVDDDRWTYSGEWNTPASRAYLVNQIEELLKQSEAVKTDGDFIEFNQELQGFLHGTLQAHGHAAWNWVKHQVVGHGLEDLFGEMPETSKAPYTELLQLSDKVHHAVSMREKGVFEEIRVEMKSTATDPKVREAATRLMQGLQETKLDLWYGYKQHKYLSRWAAERYMKPDIIHIREANRQLDAMIERLEAAQTPADLERELKQLYTLLKDPGTLGEWFDGTGLLHRAFSAAEMDGTEHLIGLIQTIGIIIGTTLLTEGLGTAGAVANAARTAGALKTVGTTVQTVKSAEAVASLAVNTSKLSVTVPTLTARAVHGFKMGVTIATAENVVAVASGEVRHGDDNLLKWVKDAASTGLAMGMFTPFAARTGELLHKNILERIFHRYVTNPLSEGALRLLGDTALEVPEELVDQGLRLSLDGNGDALTKSQARETIAISMAGGGTKIGAVAQSFKANSVIEQGRQITKAQGIEGKKDGPITAPEKSPRRKSEKHRNANEIQQRKEKLAPEVKTLAILAGFREPAELEILIQYFVENGFKPQEVARVAKLVEAGKLLVKLESKQAKFYEAAGDTATPSAKPQAQKAPEIPHEGPTEVIRLKTPSEAEAKGVFQPLLDEARAAAAAKSRSKNHSEPKTGAQKVQKKWILAPDGVTLLPEGKIWVSPEMKAKLRELRGPIRELAKACGLKQAKERVALMDWALKHNLTAEQIAGVLEQVKSGEKVLQVTGWEVLVAQGKTEWAKVSLETPSKQVPDIQPSEKLGELPWTAEDAPVLRKHVDENFEEIVTETVIPINSRKPAAATRAELESNQELALAARKASLAMGIDINEGSPLERRIFDARSVTPAALTALAGDLKSRVSTARSAGDLTMARRILKGAQQLEGHSLRLKEAEKVQGRANQTRREARRAAFRGDPSRAKKLFELADRDEKSAMQLKTDAAEVFQRAKEGKLPAVKVSEPSAYVRRIEAMRATLLQDPELLKAPSLEAVVTYLKAKNGELQTRAVEAGKRGDNREVGRLAEQAKGYELEMKARQDLANTFSLEVRATKALEFRRREEQAEIEGNYLAALEYNIKAEVFEHAIAEEVRGEAASETDTVPNATSLSSLIEFERMRGQVHLVGALFGLGLTSFLEGCAGPGNGTGILAALGLGALAALGGRLYQWVKGEPKHRDQAPKNPPIASPTLELRSILHEGPDSKNSWNDQTDPQGFRFEDENHKLKDPAKKPGFVDSKRSPADTWRRKESKIATRDPIESRDSQKTQPMLPVVQRGPGRPEPTQKMDPKPRNSIPVDRNPTVRIERPQPGMGRALIPQGPQGEWSISSTMKEAVIGRNQPDVTIDLQDLSISRRHAAIFKNQGEPWLRDLGSAKGTTLNGKPLKNGKAEQLRSGDLIGFANKKYFQYDIDAEGNAKLTPVLRLPPGFKLLQIAPGLTIKRFHSGEFGIRYRGGQEVRVNGQPITPGTNFYHLKTGAVLQIGDKVFIFRT